MTVPAQARSILPPVTRRAALGILGAGAAVGLLPTGTYAVNPFSSAAASTPFADLRARRLAVLVGAYDASDPDLQTIVGGQAAEARAQWQALDRSPARLTLWADRGSAVDPSHTRISYDRLRTMASAYASPGSDLFQNAGLGADLVAALDWLYENRYNPSKPKAGNWWEWEIGSPLRLNDCCVLLRDLLGEARIASYMNAIRHFSGRLSAYTGANLVWVSLVAAMRGANADDPVPLAAVQTGVSSLFPYVTKGDGFYRDGSFVQHQWFAYTGGYGSSLILYLADLLNLLSGSQWDIVDAERANVENWVFDSFDPVLRRGAIMDMVRGREASRYYTTDRVAGHNVLGSILGIAGSVSAEARDRMYALVKQHLTADTFRSFFVFDAVATERTRVGTAALAKSILVDAAVAQRDDLEGHVQFPAMDRAVHLRPEFALGISLLSSRSRNYESINKENMRAWYTADGMTSLYNDDLAHYSDQYWSTVDPYRLPGTTVDTQPRATVSIQNYANAYQPSTAWAGGAVLDDRFGAVGMELDAEAATLTARKSWFCIDDEVVCLGAGITSTDGRVVETIIENRKLADATAALVVDGTTQPADLGWTADLSGASWAHLDGVGGYVLLEPGTLRAKRETRTGSWFDFNQQVNNDPATYTRDYATLWLDHGANPTGGTYAYVLLPGASVLETRVYAAVAKRLRIATNTADAQAVRVIRHGLLAANVWAAGGGTVDHLTVDRPCSVVVRDRGRQVTVAVSDPTQLAQGPITISLKTRVASLVPGDDRVALVGTKPLAFTVDVTGAAGQTIVATFDRSA